MELKRLQASFERVKAHGDNFPLFFYAYLFLAHPELRAMFPASMSELRRHLMAAIKHIVATAGDTDHLAPYLQKLGVTHRGFGVLHDGGHYEAVGASLLAALEHFEGEHWAAVKDDWVEAFELISKVMRDAARENEQTTPAWWTGTVISCERHAHNIAVLRVSAEPRLDYLPGQSVAVQVGSRPRLWRNYAVACPPRDDGVLEFHVRVLGPNVSLGLALAKPGTQLWLKPAEGNMTLRDAGPAVMAAWSTGLAPMLALLGQTAALPSPPKVHLYWGARAAEEMYLWPEVEKMAAEWRSWLTVTPVVSSDPAGLADAVAAGSPWNDRTAYVAGPSKPVSEVIARLTADGMTQTQIRMEDFTRTEP